MVNMNFLCWSTRQIKYLPFFAAQCICSTCA